MISLRLTINNRQIFTILWTVIFRIIIDLLYILYVHVEFEYHGFIMEYSHLKNVISLLLLIIFSYFLPQKITNVSDVSLTVLFLLLYLPIGTFWVFSDGASEWFFMCNLFWLILTVIARSKFKIKELRTIGTYSDKTYFYVVSALCVIGLLVIGLNAKWTFNLDFFKVYEIRASNPMENVPFSGYLIAWVNVLLRFLAIYAIVKFLPRFNILVLSSLIIFLALFSVSGHKSMFFIPLLLVGTYLLLKTVNFYRNLIIILLAIFSIGAFTYFVFEDGKILTMALRRVFLVPAQLSFYYHDFFEESPLYLSNSIMSGFVDYPFDRPVPFVIAKEYFGVDNMSSNNGVIADGFMHFGFLGIVLWSSLLGLLLKVCDMLIKNKPILIFLPLYVVAVRFFVNGALLTTILTHGFWLLIMLSYFYPAIKTKK